MEKQETTEIYLKSDSKAINQPWVQNINSKSPKKALWLLGARFKRGINENRKNNKYGTKHKTNM